MAGYMPVLGRTSAEISKSFVEQMPVSLKKDTFFEEVCSGLVCVCQDLNNELTYSIEGPWESVLEAQRVLLSWFKKWTSDVVLGDTNNDVILDGKVKESTSLGTKVTSLIVSTKSVEIDDFSLVIQNEGDTSTSISGLPTILNVELPFEDKEKTVEESITEQRAQLSQSEFPSKQTYNDKEKEGSDVLTHEKSIPLPSSTVESREKESQAESDGANAIVHQEATQNDEICAQLEHNYLGSENKNEQEGGKESVENEIYMDIKLLKKTDNKIFDDPNFPVALILTSEYQPCAEEVQLQMGKDDAKGSLGEKRSRDYLEDQQERLRLRRKKYEEDTPDRFFCTQCSYKTKRQSHMKKHARLHERVCKIYSCPDCNFSTIRLCHLQRHARSHQTLDFACTSCSYSTHRKELLLRHHRSRHMNKLDSDGNSKDMFHCLKCSYITTSRKFLERHMAVHVKNEKEGKAKPSIFKCENCFYKTPSRSNYYRHIANVHGDDRPYLCNTCGLSFKRSDTLFQHKVTHCDVEPQQSFQCFHCKKYYRTAKLLQEHLLTHGEDRSYLCEVCGSAFKTRAVQRKHLQEVHAKSKNHGCSVCGKKFISNFLLKRHLKVHPEIHQNLVPLNTEESPLTNSIGSKPWQNLGTSSDVQVIIVQPDNSASEIVLNQNPRILVQDSSLPILTATTAESGQTLTVPIEFVVSEDVATASRSTENQCTSQEEYISLTFA